MAAAAEIARQQQHAGAAGADVDGTANELQEAEKSAEEALVLREKKDEGVFEECSLTREYWDRVNKDMKVQKDNPVQVSKPSILSQ